MLINYLKPGLLILLIAICTLSCGGKDPKEEGDENDSTQSGSDVGMPANDVTAICVWSSVTLRDTPNQKGKYKSTMYLGEKGVFLGEKVTDSTDAKNKREYIKIKLTDGNQGWVQSNMMVVGGKPYAIKEKTKLYKRPDILSVGKDEFDKMQFVVSLEEQGEWVKVKGKKNTDSWFKEGWVKMDRLASEEVDITVAIFTERALMKDTEEKKIEALKEITDNSDFSSSIFINDVRSMVEANNPTEVNDNGEATQEEEYIEGD